MGPRSRSLGSLVRGDSGGCRPLLVTGSARPPAGKRPAHRVRRPRAGLGNAGARMSSISDDLRTAALRYHRFPRPGKLEIVASKPLANQRDLALAYSPGLAA